MDHVTLEEEEIIDVTETEHHVALQLIAILCLATISLCVDAFIYARKWTFVPASGLFILIGAIFSIVMLAFYDAATIESMFGFKFSTFTLVLLPPIIFNGAYTLKQRWLLRQMPRVLTFAFGGTLISAVVVAVPIRLLSGSFFPSLSWPESFMFGALISAVDPVACLITYASVGATPRLYALVFGESTINDGVSIVIFRIAAACVVDNGEHVDASAVTWRGVREFLGSTLGSTAFGLVLCIFLALLTKYMRSIAEEHSAAVLIVSLSSFISFVAAEIMGISGIVSCLVFGLAARHYVVYNFTKEVKHQSLHFSSFLSKLAETVVYIQLGISVVLLRHWHVYFFFLVLLLVLLGRTFNIIPLSLFLRYFCAPCVRLEREEPVTAREQVALLHAGLRGAIAFALVLAIPGYDEHNQALGILRSTTLLVVIVTIFLSGTTTSWLLNALHLTAAVSSGASMKCQVCGSLDAEHILTGKELRELRFDGQYIRPWLVYNNGFGVNHEAEKALDERYHSDERIRKRKGSGRRRNQRGQDLF